MGQRVTTLDDMLIDPGSFKPAASAVEARNPLAYPDYEKSLDRARASSGADVAVIAGAASIHGHVVEIALFQFDFLGGSMGAAEGEVLARAMERAGSARRPFVLRTATGGARMQEGMSALVQMPKVVAARLSLSAARQPFIAVLGDPTTGGVLASIGALADVTLAEAGATIGFAGPRVVEQFTGRKPGPNSHRAESALARGLVDAVIEPEAARERVAHVLGLLAPDAPEGDAAPKVVAEAGSLEEVDAWGAVEAARAPGRLRGRGLIEGLADDRLELHGDRAGSDDPALVVALARVQGRRAMILALDHDRPPAPSAYRKARRVVATADRLGIPIVTLIDTPGADPSDESEGGGIAWEIAALFAAVLSARVPILSIVTGEGGSGGALALGSGDLLLAYADSIFSVIGPEAAATILWRDAARAGEAARLLRLTARDLLHLGIADGVVDEPLTPESLRGAVAYHLDRLAEDRVDPDQRVADRRQRWRERG